MPPLMEFPRSPGLRWHKQPPPVSGITWCGLYQRDGTAAVRPDRVWLHYVGREHRHQVLCIFWTRLTDAIDRGAYQAEHGGPPALWSDAWRERHG
jgi:hypothetical protein